MDCETCIHRDLPSFSATCVECGIAMKNYQHKTITNADRLRAMSDEELAEWVWGAETAGRAYGPRGKKAWLDWLKQEAKDEP